MEHQDPSGRTEHIYRMDAVTFYKLRAIVDRNNKMMKELQEEEKRKDRIIKDLTIDRLCLEHLHARSMEKVRGIYASQKCEE